MEHWARRWSERPRAGDVAFELWERGAFHLAIGPHSRRAQRFAEFGDGSAICFPPAAIFGEAGIRIGRDVLIGPRIALSAGMLPGQDLINDEVVVIGDRSLIGRNSSIVGHLSITIGEDVFFGPNVYVTDQNHALLDLDRPIGHQAAVEEAVTIGDGSWIAANSVITPGVTIGRQVTVGANSVVVDDLPDRAVAVGAPARVVRIVGDGEELPHPLPRVG
jgi:acetyltransferase-like isoleucine patch superfamily enzyme